MTIEGAIAQLQELIDNDGIPFWAKPSLQKVMETVKMEREQHIEALQERKTGKWIDHIEDGYVECPVCGHLTTCWNEDCIEELHYCFWCGARLTIPIAAAADADDTCDNDCEHCDWATCPKEEANDER